MTDSTNLAQEKAISAWKDMHLQFRRKNLPAYLQDTAGITSSQLELSDSFGAPEGRIIDESKKELDILATLKQREVNVNAPDAVDPDRGDIDWINSDEETRWLGDETPSQYVNRAKDAQGIALDDPNYLGNLSVKNRQQAFEDIAIKQTEERDIGLGLSHFEDDRIYKYIANAEYARTGIKVGMKNGRGSRWTKKQIVSLWAKEKRARIELGQVQASVKNHTQVKVYNTSEKLDAILSDHLWNEYKGRLWGANSNTEEKILATTNALGTVLTDLSTAGGLVIGRIAGKMAGSKYVNSLAKDKLIDVEKVFRKKHKLDPTKSVSEAIKDLDISTSEQTLLKMRFQLDNGMIRNSVIDDATKLESKVLYYKTVGGDVLGTGTIEAGGQTFANYLYQQAEMNKDNRVKLNKKMLLLNSGFGMLSATPTIALTAFRRGSVIDSNKIPLLYDNYLKQLDASTTASNIDIKKTVQKIQDETPQVWDDVIEKMKGNSLVLSSFVDKAKRGEKGFLDQTGEKISDELMFYDLFFRGHEDLNIKGVLNIFEEYGIGYGLVGRGDMVGADGKIVKDNFSNWVGDLLLALPDNVKKEVDNMFDLSLKESGIERFKGQTLEEFVDADANIVRRSAQILGQRSYFSQMFKKVLVDLQKMGADGKPVQLTAEELLDAPKPGVMGKVMNDVDFLQGNYIRGLIAHIGTTMLNVKGWQWATATQSASDVVKMALYYGESGLNLLTAKKGNAKELVQQGNNVIRLNSEKLRSLWNADTTYAEMTQVYEANPEAISNLVRYFIGGLDNAPVKGGPGFLPESFKKLDSGFLDAMQIMSGAKAVDVFTKFVELNYGLNRFALEKYGMTHTELLNSPNVVKILNSDEYANGMLKAARLAATNTWSRKFGKSKSQGGDLIQQVALIIEEFRTVKVLGIDIPFGQFFNNTIAYMVEHSPVGPIKYIFDRSMGKKIDVDDPNTFRDHLAKSVVGTSLIMYYSNESETLRDIADGLGWTQGRDRLGNVIKKTYKFPEIFFRGIGRMVSYGRLGMKMSDKEFKEIISDIQIALDDPERSLGDALIEAGEDVTDIVTTPVSSFFESIPAELVLNVGKELGPSNLTRGLSRKFDDIGRNLRQFLTGETSFVESFLGGLQSIGATYTSGKYRSFDMINTPLEAIVGEEFQRYKKGESEHYWKLISYTDTLLNSILDTEQAPIKNDPLRERGIKSTWFNGYLNDRPSAFERLMNQAELPTYKASMTNKFGEVTNHFNDMVWSVLERKASVLEEKTKWKTLGNDAKSNKLKLKYINQAITSARAEIVKKLTDDFEGYQDSVIDTDTGFIIKEKPHNEERKLYLLSQLAKKGSNIKSINKKIKEYDIDGDPMFTDSQGRRITNVYDLSNTQLNSLVIMYDKETYLEKEDLDIIKKN